MTAGENRATRIFLPYRIGCLEIRKRFVRSATGESEATAEGVLREEIFSVYEALAALKSSAHLGRL